MVVDVKKLMGRVDCLQQNQWNMDYDGAMKPLKGKEGNNWNSFPNSQTAFLGPQLWEKKISMSNVDQDFKNWQGYRGWNETQQNCQNVGSYQDQQQQHLQAMEQGFQTLQQGFQTLHQQQIQEWAFNPPKIEPAKMMDTSPHSHHQQSNSSNPSPPCRMETKNDDVEFKVSDDDLALAIVPGAQFDPKTRCFSAEELKPQPIIRKRAKHFTAENDKDDRYWEKRSKNNIAARRSREARRLKENQIALRAAYLEKQNMHLKVTLKRLNIENAHIKVNVDHLLARIVEKQKSMEAERINNLNNNLVNNQIINNSNNCSTTNQLQMAN